MDSSPNVIQLPAADHPSAPPSSVGKKQPKKKRPPNTMPDGRKRVRLTIGKNPDGSPDIRNFTGATLAEAKKNRDDWIKARDAALAAEALASPPIDPMLDPAQTVAHWVGIWLDTYGSNAGYSANTTTSSDCDKIIAALGDRRLCDVRELHMQEFARSMSHYAKSTVNKMRITCDRVFSRAVANRIIPVNPCAGVRWDNSGAGTHRFLDEWEIAHIGRYWREYRVGRWAMLMLFAGLRRGEALALKGSDIDMKAKLIHVTKGVHFENNLTVIDVPKTPTSIRDVPILPPLYDMLSEIALTDDAYICASAAGKLVTQSVWVKSWQCYHNAMQRALIAEKAAEAEAQKREFKPDDVPEFSIRAHDLRHSFASILYDAGVDVLTAQKYMGHASPEITMKIYTHLSERRKQASLSKLEKYTRRLASKFTSGTENGTIQPQSP